MSFKRIASLFSALVLSFASLFTIAFSGLASAAGPFTCTWTGGGGNSNFSTPSNWSGCNGSAPVNTDNDLLVFDNSSLSGFTNLNDDISNLTVSSITFQGSSNFDYDIGGSDISIDGSINTTGSGGGVIDSNIILTGDLAANVGGSAVVINGIISGNHNITASGGGNLDLEGANIFIGNLTANGGSLVVGSDFGLGDSSNQVTINNGADLQLFGDCGNSSPTYPNPITLTGASSMTSGQNILPKLGVFPAPSCSNGGGGGGADEIYAQESTNSGTPTLTGKITLGSNVTFGGTGKTTTLSGPLSGNFQFTLLPNWGGALVVNSSNNSSATANGTYNPSAMVVSLTDSQPSSTVEIGNNAVVTIDGTRSDVTIDAGGTLKGNGSVGNLTANKGGTIAPGHSPGCLTINGNLNEGGTDTVQIGGANACTGYDQLIVSGTVTLDDGNTPPNQGTLNIQIIDGYSPAAGTTFEIINNKGSSAVKDTFANLPEGSELTVNGVVFKITYKGGDGNDVVLTVMTNPKAPNTGIGLSGSKSALPMIGSALIAGTLILVPTFLSRKTAKATKRS